METTNPVLNNRVVSEARVLPGGQSMTVQGTINKALMLFFILLVTAGWTWGRAHQPMGASGLQGIFLVGLIGGLALAIASAFKPAWTPVTAPLYAACEGLVLGFLSAVFEAKYPGIVVQAVGLTFGVLTAMLVGYKTGWLQATPALQKGLFVAMAGLMLFYVVVWIAAMFGIQPPAFINGGGPLGIAFSLVIVGMAALSLVLDFGFIESAARENVNKYMEWYGAFSLMVTLIWLYIEILRLLSKVNSRN
jgi:uncharacterized YccA/Bax inhibitor family protein